eukprot:13770771-Alexandrium_andersonii.AAC.1
MGARNGRAHAPDPRATPPLTSAGRAAHPLLAARAAGGGSMPRAELGRGVRRALRCASRAGR